MSRSRNRDVLDLPSEFYARRSWLSEAVAACVLWEPSYAPTRKQLPRELVIDKRLLCVLAKAVRCSTAEKMAREIAKDLGVQYPWKLLELLGIAPVCSPQVFVWNVDWYVHQLVCAESLYRRHLAALHAVSDLQREAGRDFWTEASSNRA